jgi:hypothetical protein
MPCSTHGREEECVQLFCGKAERKRPLGRGRHRWEDNINRKLEKWDGVVMDWINLAQDRDQWWALVYLVMSPWVP